MALGPGMTRFMVNLRADDLAELAAWAEYESRSKSNMIRALLVEALRARRSRESDRQRIDRAKAVYLRRLKTKGTL